MQVPFHEQAPSPEGQSLRVLLWDRDLVDMSTLDAAGRKEPFKGKGSTWHVHDDWELTLILGGEGIVAVGDAISRFTAPDLILLGPQVPHVWRSDGLIHGVSLQFHLDAQQGRGGLGGFGESAALEALAQQARFGVRWHGAAAADLREQIIALTHQPALRRLSAFLAILATMAETCASDGTTLSGSIVGSRAIARRNPGMGRVIDHILRHFRDEITLAEVVRLSGVSQATFCRHFPRITGRTFVAYLTALRLQEAQRALLATDDDVTAIAYAAGFGNLAHFHATFRAAVGCTPLTYRRRGHGQSAPPSA